MARCSVLICIFAFGLLVGCGDTSVPLVAVNGTVELDGKPLADGVVTLVGETGAAPNVLNVVNGKFEGQATAGKKTVQIRAFKLGEPTKMGDTVVEATKVNYLPSAYNTDSKIKAEVGANGGITPNKFEAKSN